ncbi:retinol dehydrogenase 12 [Zophobas morio]|uniref:retinol dehydrogenase 12 n=1 Tax=Zophobas morio TaxID=2755281 RepID=UPI00308332B3
MFLLIGCGIIIVVTAVAIWRSKKPLNQILAEAKYELVYNALGSRAVLEDMVMKSKNKTDLPVLTGKVALITGGARGIGAEVVQMLLQCDVHVIIGCRNVQAGDQVLQRCRDKGVATGDISVYKLDISHIESVKSFAKVVAEKHPKINYLINNAGIMFGPYIESRDGFESQFSTNYLGHFLLTHLLFPQICAGGTESANSRIVNVSSCAYQAGKINFEDINNRERYIAAEAYAQSKLAQILFTNYVERICRKEKFLVQTHSVHPGIVNTELFDGTYLKNLVPWVPSLVFKTPEQGAVPIIHSCVSPRLEGRGGTYIHNCRIFATSETAKSEDLQEKLFNFTKDLLKIDDFGRPRDNNN